MARRNAFLTVMGFARRHRLPWIGARAAERLLSGAPASPEHRRLAALLSAAAGPPRAAELTGDRAALAAYRTAGRHPAPAVRAPRVPSVRLTRALAVKVAAGLAALSVGSAALAAQTGRLPGPAQQAAHDLLSSWGVPVPEPPRREPPPPGTDGGRPEAPTRSPEPGPDRTGPRTGPRPAPPAPPVAPSPSATELRRLCTVFVRHERYPEGTRPPTAAETRVLAAAAGGAANIPAYCDKLLGSGRPPADRTAPPPPPPERTAPPQRDTGTPSGRGDPGPRPSPSPSPSRTR